MDFEEFQFGSLGNVPISLSLFLGVERRDYCSSAGSIFFHQLGNVFFDFQVEPSLRSPHPLIVSISH